MEFDKKLENSPIRSTRKVKPKPKLSRVVKFGEIREIQRRLIPAKTILFMFITVVIFAIAFGVLYDSKQGLRSQSEQSQQSEHISEHPAGYDKVYRKRNTSTNTGIIQDTK